MSDMDDYQVAFSRLEAAEIELEKVRSRLESIKGSLANTERATIPGIAPISARKATSYSQTVLTLDSWPTAEAIKAAVIEWQTARQALLSLWEKIPEAKRSSLQPPLNAPGGTGHYRYRNAY